MNYLSVCSGIEAATVAWHPLGWRPVAFSEIDPFPCAVLQHHYPNIPNWGDMTKFQEWPDETIDLIVGGTPCQSFSVAGLRKGLADPRGNLMLTFLGLVDCYQPGWVVWENVPGVLSSNGGRDFGTFLGALGELGYGWAYRVLDAQWFGVAQRRRRVFVVGCFGNWRRAAKVLFERESVCRDPAPSREARQDTTGNPAQCFAGSRQSDVAAALETTAHDYSRADGFNTVVQPIAFNWNAQASQLPTPARDTSKTDSLTCSQGAAVAQPIAPSLTASNDPSRSPQSSEVTQQVTAVYDAIMQVRRLTPVECERLQGFPDNYTNIPWRKQPTAPDGPRYKALGNSMAVPCMRWIGQRIKDNDPVA